MKFLNSLDILGSGGTLLDVQGSQGQLFSVTDSLSGSIFAVSDISGVPILDVNSSGTSYFSGDVGIGTTSPATKLHIAAVGAPYIRIQDLDGTNQYGDIGHNNGQTIYVSRNNTDFGGHAFYSANGTTTQTRVVFGQDFGVGSSMVTATGAAGNSYGGFLAVSATATAQMWASAGGLIYIGSRSNHDLNFSVNNQIKMMINTTGNVGIGTTAPGAKLDVSQTTTGIGAIIGNTTHNSQLQIYTAAASKNSEIWFGDAADADVGKIDYDHANDSMSFFVGATKRLSIDSAGTILLGDNTTAYQTVFFDPTPGTVYGNGTLQIQPTTSPGSGIAQFTTNFADRVGGGTTKHNVRVGGTVTATDFIGGSGAYLPLAGGTLTGALTGTTATFAGDVTTNGDITIDNTSGDPFLKLKTSAQEYVLRIDQSDSEKFQIRNTTSSVTALSIDASSNATFAGIVGIGAAPTTEANLSLGAKSVSEGGHLILNKGTSYTLATHLDNYASSFRVMSGTDNSSSAVQFSINHSTAAAAFTGTVTAPTFIGDLNGTINTVTTAVTKANATNDTTVATTAFVQNLIGTIPAGLVFQGTWNAATNTPTLTSGSGTTGHFYIVSTSGSTNLDGVTDWVTGDWAVFIEQGGTDEWEKIDNSSVLDGAGTGQTLPLWSGSGTSNTLTDSNITQDANLITKFGKTAVTTTAVASINHASNDFLYINGGTGGTSIGDDDQNTRALFYNNDYIRFDAAGAERMRIESDGIISIGEGATQSWIANKVQTTTTAVSGKQSMSDIDRTTANWMRITNPVYSTNGSVGLIMRTFPNSDARQGAGIIASGGSDNAATDLDLFVSRQTSGATTSTSYSALSIKGNTGKVGIGTTSPDYLLDLYRSTGTTGSTTGTTLQRLWNYVGSDLQQQKTFVDFVFQDDNDNEYPQVRIGAEVGQNGNADTQEKEGSGAFVVYTNNATGTTPGTPTGLAERFRVDYQGNVGIGTTAPSAKLHIVDGNNYAKIGDLQADSTMVLQLADTSTQPVEMQAYGSELRLNTATTSGATPSVKMNILPNGNVGIGTTSPVTKLEVPGSTTNSSIKVGSLEMQSYSVNNSWFAENVFYNGTGWKLRSNGFASQMYMGAGGDISFKRFATGTAGSTATPVLTMQLQSDGNVGIGTVQNAVQSKLQVAGGIQMADDTATATSTKVGTMRYRTDTEYVEVDGVELVTNGDFATDTDWSKGTGWTIANGKATNDGTSGSHNLSQNAGLVVGNQYKIDITITDYVSGSVEVSAGATPRGSMSAIGTYTFYQTCAPGANFYIIAQTFNGSVDNVSVMEVTAEDASYADMCMQTGSSTYEWVNIVRNTY